MAAHLLGPLLLAGWAATLGQGLVLPRLPVYAGQLVASGFVVGCIFGVFRLPTGSHLETFDGREACVSALMGYLDLQNPIACGFP